MEKQYVSKMPTYETSLIQHQMELVSTKQYESFTEVANSIFDFTRTELGWADNPC